MYVFASADLRRIKLTISTSSFLRRLFVSFTFGETPEPSILVTTTFAPSASLVRSSRSSHHGRGLRPQCISPPHRRDVYKTSAARDIRNSIRKRMGPAPRTCRFCRARWRSFSPIAHEGSEFEGGGLHLQATRAGDDQPPELEQGGQHRRKARSKREGRCDEHRGVDGG